MSVSLIEKFLGKNPSRPPVWFMRQAGRCIPEYRRLKEDYSFFDLMNDPFLAKQVTLQPIEKLGVDAAILFSDILIVIEALGKTVEYGQGKPRIVNPLIKQSKIVSNLLNNDFRVFDRSVMAIKEIKKQSDLPLIGFAGGPLTIFLYLYEGMGGNFSEAKYFIEEEKKIFIEILHIITDISIQYAELQIAAGVDAFQLFESWAGEVPFHDYEQLVLPEILRMKEAIHHFHSKDTPTVFFPKGLNEEAYFSLADKGFDALSVHHSVSIESLAKKIQDAGIEITLQGNIDPKSVTRRK